MYTTHSLHEGVKFLIRARTRKLIYTMGILYGRIPTWLTEQAVNSSRWYVSATSVRRLLSQALVEITIL